MKDLSSKMQKSGKMNNLQRSYQALLFAVFVSLGATPALAGEQIIPTALQDVAHIHQPNETHFTGGQPTAPQFEAFAEQGVRHVVDLRPPEESADINSAAWVSAAGMAYYHIPIAGGADLTREHVAVLDTILQRMNGEPALLHCASANRVGAMMALHAVWYQEMSEEDAVQLGRDYGLTSLEEHVRKALQQE